MSDTFYGDTYSSSLGFIDKPEEAQEPLDVSAGGADGAAPQYDMNTEMLRLMQLQRGVGPTQAFSTEGQAGPLNAQFTGFERSGHPQMTDAGRMNLGVNTPIDENLRLGAGISAIQNEQSRGETMVRPALNVGYGPISASAGYVGRTTPIPGQQFAFAPTYGLNLNLPVGEGQFSGGLSKTVGQQNPYAFASYQYPFLGGTLGVELSTADRLRNLAALLAYRRPF